MRAFVLLAIGVVNIVFGLKRRSKNLPITKEYKDNIERKYVILNETGLRDFEEFAVIFLGLIIVLTSIGMMLAEYFSISESFQVKVFIVLAIIATYSYRTVRGNYIEKLKR